MELPIHAFGGLRNSMYVSDVVQKNRSGAARLGQGYSVSIQNN